MSKAKSVFVCTECGCELGKWMGKCPGCGAFATMAEQLPVQKKAAAPVAVPSQAPLLLREIDFSEAMRIKTGIAELDRVLGGGLVPGSSILVGGDPGIGKSTMMLQVAASFKHGKVLYVSGEESPQQISLRAKRLGIDSSGLYILGETEMTQVQANAASLGPSVIIVDSIQTMRLGELNSLPGSVAQVRQATAMLSDISRATGATLFIIGHVTKEGAIAGPKVLEHMVDTVLYFEGGKLDALRVLRSVKNRFGSTNEIGIFEMSERGMSEVSRGDLIAGYQPGVAGSAVCATLEGSRCMLLELQALLCQTPFGNARRVATGVDYNRMALLLAVLEKREGLRLIDQDAYLNVVGGIKIEERAADLAIAMAVASSYRNRCVRARTAVIGEIGLTGEVRMVSQIDKRVSECEKLGFERVILPKANARAIKCGIEVCAVSTLGQALEYLE